MGPPAFPRGAPGRRARREGQRALALGLLLVALLLALLVAAAGLGLLGAAARWGIIVVVLTIAAWSALAHVRRRSPGIPALAPPPAPGPPADDPLGGLVAQLRAAERGRPFAQLLLAQRVAEALLERVRIERGLARQALPGLRRDPGALAALVGDPLLVAFLAEVEEAPRRLGERRGPGLLGAPQRPFLEGLEGVLRRAEGWR